MTMTRIYLAGWLFTLFVLCVAPIPRRTLGGDAVTAALLLAWPMLWVASIISALIQIRDDTRR